MNKDSQLIFESYITEVIDHRTAYLDMLDGITSKVFRSFKAMMEATPGLAATGMKVPDFALHPDDWRPDAVRDEMLSDIIDFAMEAEGLPKHMQSNLRPHIHSLVLKKFVEDN